MKILINTKKIKDLNPCRNRLDNWLYHCHKWSGDIVDFLQLTNITPKDKVWVAVRVIPRFLVEVFAIDCAFNVDVNAGIADAAHAYAANAAASAADAADAAAYAAAAYAADAAAYAADAAYSVERSKQVESLIYLITTTTKKEAKLYE